VTVNDGSSEVKIDTPAIGTTTSVFTGLDTDKVYTVIVVAVSGDDADAATSAQLSKKFATSEYIFLRC